MTTNITNGTIPDITALDKAENPYPLEKVGMNNMEIPIVLQPYANKPAMLLTAHIDAMVNLNNASTKGIHMSRLYLLVYRYFQCHQSNNSALNTEKLNELLEMLIKSQKGISDQSFLKLRFNFPMEQKALLSNNTGSRFYPIELSLSKNNNQALQIGVKLTLTYSSTCPCSAALSRQLIRQKVQQTFTKKTMVTEDLLSWLEKNESSLTATPHSQRSFATLKFSFANNPKEINLNNIIDTLEKVLPTPVQAAVKREDEQEFARLNGENLIFCEDIARILKKHMENNATYKDYYIKVSHEESLHAHDAVAETFRQK